MSRRDPLQQHSYIRQLYDRITQAVIEGASHKDVMERALPLILTDLEAEATIYPEAKAILRGLFESLWKTMFPQIPPPSLGEDYRIQDLPDIVRRTLDSARDQYKERLAQKTRGPVTTKDVDDAIAVDTIRFMDALIRSFTKNLGLW